MALVACGMSAHEPLAADPVVALMGSRLGPYLEALEGFREGLGREVPSMVYDGGAVQLGRHTRVVVTFGGRAALAELDGDVTVVSCLAPGMEARIPARRGRSVRVDMLPRPPVVLAGLHEIQPDLRRLAVLWISEGLGGYVGSLSATAREMGITVEVVRLASVEQLPDQLRALARRSPEALWLPPDPLLVNQHSFSMLKSFCATNRIPFYVPSEGLVEEGALAAVSSDFREIGRAAAGAVRALLARGTSESTVYPAAISISVNLNTARQCGLEISPAVMRRARVYR